MNYINLESEEHNEVVREIIRSHKISLIKRIKNFFKK
jgi:hypothetical protein